MNNRRETLTSTVELQESSVDLRGGAQVSPPVRHPLLVCPASKNIPTTPPLIVWPRLRKRIYRSFSPFKVWPNGIVKPALSETRDYSVYQRIRGINSFNPFCPERNERATLFCDNRVWFYLHLNFTLYFIIWC